MSNHPRLDEFTQGRFKTMGLDGGYGSTVEGRSIDEAKQAAFAAGYDVIDVTEFEGEWLLVIADEQEIHLIDNGRTLCGRPMPHPARWTRHVENATCTVCLLMRRA